MCEYNTGNGAKMKSPENCGPQFTWRTDSVVLAEDLAVTAVNYIHDDLMQISSGLECPVLSLTSKGE